MLYFWREYISWKCVLWEVLVEFSWTMIEPVVSARCAHPVCPTPSFDATVISCECLRVLRECPTCLTKPRRCSEDNPCLVRFSDEKRKSLSADSGGSFDIQVETCSPPVSSCELKTSANDSNEGDIERNLLIAARKLSWKVRLPDLSALSDKLVPSLIHMAVKNERSGSAENHQVQLWDKSSHLAHQKEKNVENLLAQKDRISSVTSCGESVLTESQEVATGDRTIQNNKPDHPENSITAAKARAELTFTPSANLLIAELQTFSSETDSEQNAGATCYSSLQVALLSSAHKFDQHISSNEAQVEENDPPTACVGLANDQLCVNLLGGRSLRSESDSGGSMGSHDLWEMVDARDHSRSASLLTRSDISLDMGISLASLEGGEDLEYLAQKRWSGDPSGSHDDRTLINKLEHDESSISIQHNACGAPRINSIDSAVEHSVSCQENACGVAHHKHLNLLKSTAEGCCLDATSLYSTDPHSSVDEFGSCASHVGYNRGSNHIEALDKSDTSLEMCSDVTAFSRVLTQRRFFSSTPNKLISGHRHRQRRTSDSCLAYRISEESFPLRKCIDFRSWPGPLKLCGESQQESSRSKRECRRRGQIFESDFSIDGRSLDSILPSISPPPKTYDLIDSPFNRFSRSSRAFRARRKGMCNPMGDNFRGAAADLSPLLQDASSQSVYSIKHCYTPETLNPSFDSIDKVQNVSVNISSNFDSENSNTAAASKPKRPSQKSCLRSVGAALRRLSSPSKNLSVAGLLGSRKCTYDLELASKAYLCSYAPSPSSFKKRKKSSHSSAQFPLLSSQPSSFPSSPCCSPAQSPWQSQRLSDTSLVPVEPFARTTASSLSSSTSSLPLIFSRGRSISVDNCVDRHGSLCKDRGGTSQALHRTLPRDFRTCSGSISLLESELDSETVRLRKVSYEHASYVRCGNSMLLLDAL